MSSLVVRELGWDLWADNSVQCKFWPMITAFTFTFIRPVNRNVFSGFIAIGWQTYLSWLNRNAEKALKAKEKAQGVVAGKGKKKKSGNQKIEQTP